VNGGNGQLRRNDGGQGAEWTTRRRTAGAARRNARAASRRWLVQDQPASVLGMDVEERLDCFTISGASDLAQEAVRLFQPRYAFAHLVAVGPPGVRPPHDLLLPAHILY